MRKANYEKIEKTMLTNIDGLKALTQTGRETAVKIGKLAGARVQIGKSVRWNVNLLQKYLDDIATD